MRAILTHASIVLTALLTAVPAAAKTRTNVAVLPFATVPGLALTDGIVAIPGNAFTDEIALALTKVPGIGVVGRSSIFTFKNPDSQLANLSRTLDTHYFVEGSVAWSGEMIHVSARLIHEDGASPVQVWATDYGGRALTGIFDIEEDIALNVAKALGHPVTLARGEHLAKRGLMDFGAYEVYLQAKDVARGRGADALSKAEDLLEIALTRDPEFEPAAAMIGYEYALTPLFAPALRSNRPDEERTLTDRLIPRADIFARRAVALDPKDATAWVGLAYVRLVHRNMIAAEDAFREAIRLDPNQADGLHGYSQFLAAMGKIKESLAMRDHLQAIEPSIVNYTADTAEIYWVAGDTGKAIQMLQPFRPGRTLELALILAASGRYHEAASALREMPQTNWPDGLLEKAAKLLDTAPAQNPPDSMPKLGSLSFTFLHVGAPERDLEYYEDEVKGGYFQPISVTWFWHPSYAPVRRTERFKKLVRDLGMVDYWRARGWPQYCHPTSPTDFACD